MRAVTEWLGLLLAFLVAIYAYSIWQATPNYRPLNACRPVIFMTGIVSRLAGATSNSPNAVGQDVSNWMNAANNGCLSYTYNLFVVGNNS